MLRVAVEVKLKTHHQKASGEQGRHSKISGIHSFDTGVLGKWMSQEARGACMTEAAKEA